VPRRTPRAILTALWVASGAWFLGVGLWLVLGRPDALDVIVLASGAGLVSGWAWITWGATAAQRAERLALNALSLREERLRLAIEGSSEGLWDWNPRTNEVHLSPDCYLFLGYAPDEFPSTPAEWHARILEEDRENALRYVHDQLAAGGDRIRVEGRLMNKSGEPRVILVRGRVATRDADGQPTRLVGTLVDITERRRAENNVRAAYGRITDILESISDGFLALDSDFVVQSFNHAAEDLLGRSREEVVGRDFLGAFPELRGSEFDVRLREALDRQEERSFETQLTTPPVEGWYEVRAFPIQRGISVFFRATTERKRLEAQLAQAQKMEAIGRLAGGVAHDFNNQLAAILGYDELILRDLPEGHAARPRAEQIRKAAQRAAVLTRQLLAFGRRQVLAPQILSLNSVVTEIEEMLRRTIGEDVTLIAQLAPDLAQVRADRAQMEQALLNMVVNARDAMPRGGQITIETRNVVLDQAHCAQHLGATPGEHVLLAVHDTGPGMDSRTLGRLFEPFFTTKEFGKGSGLGLAMVYGFVRQSGGHVTVESVPEVGTRLFVYLPQVSGPVPRAAPRAAAWVASRPARGETVLVVEDESAVRRLIVEVLRAAGYRVIEAADGDDGLRVAEAHPDVIHLLVTDMIMPCMSGRALADNLCRARPELRVLYMSGHAEDAYSDEKGAALAPMIEKPFTPTTLAQRVREALASPPPKGGAAAGAPQA
jgi:PAS domain S-box-containing protein